MEGSGTMDDSASCGNIPVGLGGYLGVLFGIAALIIVGFSFLQKRKKLRTDCFFGIPGLLQPLDFLSGQPSRLVLTAGLTALVAHILQVVIIGSGGYSYGPVWDRILDVLVRAAWIIGLTILYFPVLLSASAPIPMLGYFVGSVYVPLLVGYAGFWIVAFQRGCAFTDTGIEPEIRLFRGILFAMIPVFVCLVIAFVWYIYRIVVELGHSAEMATVRDAPVLRMSSYDYVKELFRVVLKEQPSIGGGETGKLRARLNEYRALHASNSEPTEVGIPKTIFSRKKGFVFPLSFALGLTAGVILCYQLTALFLPISLSIGDGVGEFLDNLEERFNSSNSSNNSECQTSDSMGINETMALDEILASRDRIVLGIKAFLGAGPFFSFIIILCQILPMIRSVRRHLLLAYRGDYSFCTKPSKLTPQYILRSNMKYPAYQIAYFAWSWVLYVALVWFLAIIVGIIVLLAKVFPETGLTVLLSLLLTISINFTVQGTVFVMVRFVFTDSISDYCKDLVITNRRLYNITSYFILGLTGFPGVVSALGRTLYSYIVGLLRAPRMDLPGMQRGAEFLDNGHLIYQGCVYFEAIYNSPVGHVFADLLIKGQNRAPVSGSGYPRTSKRAYNRWFVAVLLMRNHSLRKLRRTSSPLGSTGGNTKEESPLATTVPGIGSINEVELM